MKNFFVLVLASATLITACGDDDDSGSPADGGASSAGKGGSSSAGKGGSSSAGKGGSSSAGKGGTAGSGGSLEQGGASAGEGGTTAGEGGQGGSPSTSRKFTITLENVGETKMFTSSGVFDTPVGADAAGALMPGHQYEFTIDAGRKQKLSFATMLAATNDLFFGPNGDGIALYDANGDPMTGYVTDQIYLWDAGTEVNEEPKVGPNTVSKQAAPNTGPAENGNVVDISDTDDTFAYPSVADVMTVLVTHLTGTQFKVTIENVSSNMALQTSAGDFPAPLSPGVWVVHNGKDPLYTVGKPDRGQGLESVAEDGKPAALGGFAAGTSGITYPASPGAWVVHAAGSKPLFTEGAKDYGDGVEHIAEDGDPTVLGTALADLTGQLSGALFNMPVGSATAGPILPGKKYQFTVEGSPGDALSFATMLAATNDVFFAPGDDGIPLFDADENPLHGDITDRIYLWDAGTEANEEPGIGPNTVTNQLAPDTGAGGEQIVQLLSDVGDGYTYPAVESVLKVTVDPE